MTVSLKEQIHALLEKQLIEFHGEPFFSTNRLGKTGWFFQDKGGNLFYLGANLDEIKQSIPINIERMS